ncbi:MAG: helix-turn-helix domain-containing protein [Blastocatellia bacterium]|nr:helix-turn-helix domain-containing protein [Blastocatellia bacterium]
MAVSPSSSVQRARQELAERLRDLRLDAGLTGRALSRAAGWHDAKTSRIESASRLPAMRIWTGSGTTGKRSKAVLVWDDLKVHIRAERRAFVGSRPWLRLFQL